MQSPGLATSQGLPFLAQEIQPTAGAFEMLGTNHLEMSPAGGFKQANTQIGVQMIPTSSDPSKHRIGGGDEFDQEPFRGQLASQVKDIRQRDPLGDQQMMNHGQHHY